MTERYTELKPISGIHWPKCPLVIFHEKSMLLSDEENNGNRVLRLDVFAEKALTSAVISIVCTGEDGQVLREIKHDYQPIKPLHKQFGEYIFIDLQGNDVADVSVEVEKATQGNVWHASYAKQTPKGQKLLNKQPMSTKKKILIAIAVVLAVVIGGLAAFFALRSDSQGATTPQELFARINNARAVEVEEPEDGEEAPQVEEVDVAAIITSLLVPHESIQMHAEALAAQQHVRSIEFVRIVSTPYLQQQAQDIQERLNEYFEDIGKADAPTQVDEVQFAEIEVIEQANIFRVLTVIVRIGPYWYWHP